MSGATVIKLAFNQEWKVLSQALKSDPTFEVEDIANASEAATFLSTVSSALILISLTKKEDLIQVASLVKIYKKVAPDTAVKLAIINFSGDRNYEKTIAKLGIQDIMDPSINTKALRFKIDFWMKGLNAQVKKSEAALAVKTAAKTAEVTKSNQKNPDASGINWIEPMDCVDDFWLIKNESDCKRILGKWLLRITGPGPYVAQWTEVNGRNNLWKFEFRKEERESFFDSDGNWFFRGEQKPDFQWKDNVWMITGNQFDLYYQDTKKLTSRISFANKILTITKNSEYARTKETMVFGSFDKEIVLKRNGNIQSNEAVDTEAGTDKFKNLEGKGKTDKTSSGPLSGKTKGLDDLSSGLLAMDLEPGGNTLNDGTMAGPASGKVAQGPQLSVENKNNEHKKHWKGHNEAEEYDAADLSGPSSGDVRKGSLLDLENKNNEHKAHWKGHNESEKFEASEKERKNYEADRHNNYQGHLDHEKEGSKEGDYGGKSNTDKLSKFYSNGEKDRPATGKEAASQESAPLKAEWPEKKKGLLETEVSDLERERELKRQKKEAIEAKEKAAQERTEKDKREKSLNEDEAFEAVRKDLRTGKDITPAHEERNREENDREQNNMGGKGHTDKLQAHYKNRKINEEEEEEDNESDEFVDQPFNARKNHNRKESEARVRGGAPAQRPRGTKSGLAPDEDVFSEDNSGKEQEGNKNVASLEEARKVKELQRVLEEEKDPELEEATQSGEIKSFILVNNEKVSCTLDDFFDQTIIFSTNNQGINNTSEVDLDLSFNYLQKVAKLNFKGKVTETVDDQEGNKFVTVQIPEESVRAFEAFMKLYQVRQKNINFFMQKVKGV